MKISTIYLGADHAGFTLKEKIKKELARQGHEVQDLALRRVPGDDYPPYGKAVAQAVAKDKAARGILICGSGVGMAIAANRVRGARALVGHSSAETKLAREHNDVNILALSGRKLKPQTALTLIKIFLQTPFSKAARHHRRVGELG